MRFVSLYTKELRTELTSFVFVAGAIFGLFFYSSVRLEDPVMRLVIIGAMGIMLPFFGLLRLLQSLRSEWNEDTIQWLLTLPVSGWMPLGAKLLAVITSLLLLSLLLGGLSLPLLSQTFLGPHLDVLYATALKVFLMVAFSYICFLPAVIFAYLVGRGLPQWRLPVVGAVFVASIYVFSKIMENATFYLPPWYITIKNLHFTDGVMLVSEELVNISGLFGALLFGYLLLHASVRLWERRIDV